MAAETRFSKTDSAATGSEGEVREKFWRTAKKRGAAGAVHG